MLLTSITITAMSCVTAHKANCDNLLTLLAIQAAAKLT